MNISYNWLKKYIDFDWDLEELADRLTMSGLEVEGKERFESIPGGLDGVVVGEVLTCEKHPGADKLNVCSVDIGNGDPLPIVCGAPNVAAGQKVAVATVGSTLHPVEGEPFKIKKAKIRGEVSIGMICAEDELGLGVGHDGIIVLDPESKVGTAAHEIFDVEVDTILEIGLTPNRVDAASHYGTARDVAALLGKKARRPEAPEIDASTAIPNPITIGLPEPTRCDRYVGVYIEGVEIKPSPEWMQIRLKSIGLRPINNIVDITNYVLHELGQPLHAFDADHIRGKRIVVQTLTEDITFTTLDDVERKIYAGKDLMICDGDGPVAIAGIMGGQNSEVGETTTNVFLESAYFDPTGIRRTASRLGLKTDASFRFERGVDPHITRIAALRATALILELAGGKASVVEDVQKGEHPWFEIEFDLNQAKRIMGMDLPKDQIVSILTSLEIQVAIGEDKDKLMLLVPPYRVDVQRPQDIMEEILRIYGYNNVPMPGSSSMSLNLDQRQDFHSILQKYFDQLAAAGYNEILTCPLIPESYGKDTTPKLVNNLTVEMAVLREELVYTGLETIEHNHRHKNFNLQLAEFAKTYHRNEDDYTEKEWIVLYLTGASKPAGWQGKAHLTTIFTLTREMERLEMLFGFKGAYREMEENETYVYGLELMRGETVIARYGRIQNALTAKREIKGEVFMAEIDWKKLLKINSKYKVKYKPLPKFPAINRDISMIVPDNVAYSDITKTIYSCNPKMIRNVGITDVYKGDRIAEGKKSYLVNITLIDENKTLTDKAADKTMNRIFSKLEGDFGVEVRK